MRSNITLKGSLIFALLIMILSACKNPIPQPAQIEDNAFVLVLGIDKGIEDPENVRFTIVGEKSEGEARSKDNQQPVKSPDIRTAEGRTIYEAERKIRSSHEKNLTWGHTKYVLIGEDAAKDHLLDFIDLLIRDWETRLNIDILIVKNLTAEKLISMSAEANQFLPDLLNGMIKNNSRMSTSREIKLTEAIPVLNDPISDAYLPSVSVNESVTGEKTSFALDGFGLFKGSQLIGFIKDGDARGLNFISNHIKSSVVFVKDKTDKYASLVIIDSTSKIVTRFNDDLPEAAINIQVYANIGEQLSQENLYTETSIIQLENKLEEAVKKEAENALTYAQSNSIDIFGIGNKIYHQHPYKWRKVKTNWKSVFSEMKISIHVEAKIKRTYLLREPIRSTEGN